MGIHFALRIRDCLQLAVEILAPNRSSEMRGFCNSSIVSTRRCLATTMIFNGETVTAVESSCADIQVEVTGRANRRDRKMQ